METLSRLLARWSWKGRPLGWSMSAMLVLATLVPGLSLSPELMDASAGVAMSTDGDSLWVGVIGRDGVAIPVALYDRGSWSTPWPKPMIDREPGAAPSNVPVTWYAYVDDAAPVRIRFKKRVVTQAHCATNWAYTTDWGPQVPREPNTVREIAGMVLSDSLPWVAEDSIPTLVELRKHFQITTRSAVDRSRALGYFLLEARPMAVYLRRGYEDERYQIFQVEPFDGQAVVEVSGGGC